ncbi:DUF4199 domain-containing protein [Niabella beijingensis]|uniref:DUF4199 domain-containing protein n=1 Tax=Niabella beijingensis TaxID=2872700 RepID=UPI001CBF1424|nr:DUF4199 domain-containing protein [Niabella beijingensis]MBZ4189271.1 DUF4199 domain-containing protein [Niabella beijingensis]
MKKNVLIFGSVAGILLSGFMAVAIAKCYGTADFKGNEVVGYAAMLLIFSLVFVGVKNFRDRYNGGIISFGKAFRAGFLIALVASTIYVLVWLVCYYAFFPDFGDKYTEYILREARAGGASAAEMDAKAAEMVRFNKMYRNPLFVILLTYTEVLPIGTLVALISALILKRKPRVPQAA